MQDRETSQPHSGTFDGLVPKWGPQIETELGLIALHRRGPDAITFTSPVHTAIVLFTPQPLREVSLASNRQTIFDAPTGSFEIMPAGADFVGRWRVAKENLLLAFHPDKLGELAHEELSVGNLELRTPMPGFIDARLVALANLLKLELAAEENVNSLYTQSLCLAFAINMIRYHSNYQSNGKTLGFSQARAGLSTHARRTIIDYIADRVGQSLSLDELAGVIGLSTGHFLRSFKKTFGQTPHRYLVMRRIELAERLILEGRMPLSEIAQAAGFAHQSHMTVEMKRQRGYTPNALRRTVCASRAVSQHP